MSYLNKPRDTYPDEMELKMEIDKISSRINRIMEIVANHFPVNQGGRSEVEQRNDTDVTTIE
jgi:hypothetical protein